MKKARLFSLIAACAVLTGMAAGCGGNAKASKDVFPIGAVGPGTGDTAQYGLAVKKGAELAVEEINKAGGIGGKKIEFKFEDDENNAEKAVNAYNALKDWGMKISMGTVTSKPCVAVAAKTKEDNMFMMTPSATSVDCLTEPNAYRICFSDPNQGAASAKYIATNKVAEKVAVIYDSSDPYSSGIFAKFKTEAQAQNLNIVAEGAFTSDSNTDFTVQIQQAKDAGADLVFLPIYYTQAALVLRQANDAGYKPKFFGCDGLDGLMTVKDFDKSLAEGVMLLTPFAPDAQDETTKTFVAAYKAKFNNEVPNQFAADAYDVIYAIKAAAEKANLTPDMTASEMCEALKGVMTQITLDGVTGAGIVWDEKGEPNTEPRAMKIVNGVYAAM